MWSLYSLFKNEYGIFKPDKTTIRRGQGRKKKNRDEPIRLQQIYTYICRKDTTCVPDIKQTKMSFFSCKPREQEGGQVLPR
jgi:hypothetical protein